MKITRKIGTILLIIAVFTGTFSNILMADAASTIYCPNCGKQIDASSNYCMYCGYKIPHNQGSSAEPQSSSPKKYGSQLPPLNELVASNSTSRKYLTTSDLPDNVDNMERLVEDWLAYPSYNSKFHAVNSEVTIKKGEKTKLSLFRNENYNGASYSFSWYGGGDVSLDWAGNGVGWAGHSHVGYITATEECTIFMSAKDTDGITAHMVIYVK